jgi:nucleoid-associated protein YgaU
VPLPPVSPEFNPLAQTAPVPVPCENDPRFGDFQPAPAGNQYEPDVPNELPGDLLTQLSATQLAGGVTGANGQMQPSDRPEVYIVRPGDNYWNISKRQYGTVRYFTALARYNQQRIPDPKKMRPGMKVLTPTRDVLESRNPDLFPRFAANTGGIANASHQSGANAGFFVSAGGGPMYRVGPEDTLGGIAQKHLGRFSRWVEIYQLNRHRLKDPNALTLGDELQLPADASRVSMVRQASGIR